MMDQDALVTAHLENGSRAIKEEKPQVKARVYHHDNLNQEIGKEFPAYAGSTSTFNDIRTGYAVIHEQKAQNKLRV
ncbi:hypothetical protein [Asticcacaulis benevestitus]|uniref:Uncharacterized protein n=1 Tax=Asticcacaulis benevestitus DSM 16100 = ATCC BAA-896 TaxID=1121022 RepID=V4PBJ4_9CAUL|nr:hypothetical protein [Asticcacaulis benevestitus]ESQ82605.1 hypothetical protein ABENE_20825 [Asticcacaulis benevestitus DSM 16100 = ATCC BAA-896]